MGTIKDIVSGSQVDDTPEERVIQQLAEWLISLGYKRNQIQIHPQYKMARVGSKKRNHPVDLVVFSDEQRTDDNILIVAECKSSAATRWFDGLEQLKSYMRGCGAHVGIWFNGIDFTYIIDAPNSFIGSRKANGNQQEMPIRFGDFIRQRRELLHVEQQKSCVIKENMTEIDTQLTSWRAEDFSLRQLAKRLHLEPSRLSRIESNKLPPPDDAKIEQLANELRVESDTLMRLAHRLPADVQQTILLRPRVMIPLIRSLKDAPEHVLTELLARTKVRDGDW